MNMMILAAGFGTRFRPHTEKAAKPTFPFLNIPFLLYPYFWSEALGCSKTIYNTHYLPETVTDTLQQSNAIKNDLVISHETELLGSAGAFNPVKEHLADDNFIIGNADTVIIPGQNNLIEKIKETHENENHLATLLLMPHPQAGKEYGGVWVDGNNAVHGFGKSPPDRHLKLKPYHFVGVQVYSPDVFKYIPSSGSSHIFLDVLVEAIRSGEKVRAYIDDCEFFDGGSLQRYLQDSKRALELYENSEYLQRVTKRFWQDSEKRPHWKVGSNYNGPQHLLEEKYRLFGNNVSIDPSSRIENMCILGNRVKIGKNCTIKNAVIADGVVISDNSVIENDLVLD